MRYHNEKYRVKRSLEYEEKMKYLTDNNIFSSYADIIALSAMIGYNSGQFVEIHKAASDSVQLSFFSKNDRNIINLIAYAHTKKQGILDPNNNEKYFIYESYANGGFPILWEQLDISQFEPITDPSETFQNFINGLFRNFPTEITAEELLD